MVIVNGVPKSGTHAVMAWLSRMGLRRWRGTILEGSDGLRVVEGKPLDELAGQSHSRFILGHVPARYRLEDRFLVLTVFRDPRNVLVSYVRHRARDGVNVTIAEAIRDFWGSPFVPLYWSYLDWRGRSVVLRYEDLPPEQVGNGGELYAGEAKDWNTRTGVPSDWQSSWDYVADHAWRQARGDRLLEAAGYA